MMKEKNWNDPETTKLDEEGDLFPVGENETWLEDEGEGVPINSLHKRLLDAGSVHAKRLAAYYKRNALVLDPLYDEERPPVGEFYAYAVGVAKAMFFSYIPEKPVDAVAWQLFKAGTISSGEMIRILLFDHMHDALIRDDSFYNKPLMALELEAVGEILGNAKSGLYPEDMAEDITKAGEDCKRLIEEGRNMRPFPETTDIQ